MGAFDFAQKFSKRVRAENFSDEEDRKLFEGIGKFGRNFSAIKRTYFANSDRSQTMLRNRYKNASKKLA